jgi:hypothetical protein
MFNSKKPSLEELPSKKQLIQSTLIALVVSIILLVFVILPAEYGIDPTGFGKTIGLKQMGEIKVSLEEESNEITSKQEVVTPVKPVIKTVEKDSLPKLPKEKMTYTLAPGKAIEIKLVMNKDDKVNYKWVTKNGKLNHDTHGDSKTKEFISYKKGRFVDTDEGVLVAAFDGSHGWFWRNRDKQNVEVQLEVEGQFTEVLKF